MGAAQTFAVYAPSMTGSSSHFCSACMVLLTTPLIFVIACMRPLLSWRLHMGFDTTSCRLLHGMCLQHTARPLSL